MTGETDADDDGGRGDRPTDIELERALVERNRERLGLP